MSSNETVERVTITMPPNMRRTIKQLHGKFIIQRPDEFISFSDVVQYLLSQSMKPACKKMGVKYEEES